MQTALTRTNADIPRLGSWSKKVCLLAKKWLIIKLPTSLYLNPQDLEEAISVPGLE